jgi:hypothetical protein
MPSTGTATFTLTRDQLINASMRTLRVLQEGQTANATQITFGSEALNTLIKFLQSKGLQLWTYAQVQVPMVINQFTYTIGPSGANVTTVRPLRIFDGCFIRFTQAGITQDTPLTLLSRVDYLRQTAKNTQAIPNSIYYDAQINTAGGVTSPSTGYGTLYVWTNPVDAVRTIFLNVQRPIYDMNAAGDEFDFPAEWFLPLRYGLAVLLLDEYEVPEDRAKRIIAMADRYHIDVQDWSVEEQPTRFQADTTPYRRFRGR